MVAQRSIVCTSAIYLLLYLELEFCIIIYMAVGVTVNSKDVVDGMNPRYKKKLSQTRKRS